MERDLLLLYIMAVFTGVAAIALVIQMIFLFQILQVAKALRERANLFMDQWEPLAETSRQAVDDVRQRTAAVLEKLQEMAESTKSQFDKVDSVMTELSTSARSQMERVDHSVDFALRRMEEATVALQKTLLVPVRQVRGLVAAVNAVLEHLTGRRRATVDRATLDEEMFIG